MLTSCGNNVSIGPGQKSWLLLPARPYYLSQLAVPPILDIATIMYKSITYVVDVGNFSISQNSKISPPTPQKRCGIVFLCFEVLSATAFFYSQQLICFLISACFSHIFRHVYLLLFICVSSSLSSLRPKVDYTVSPYSQQDGTSNKQCNKICILEIWN